MLQLFMILLVSLIARGPCTGSASKSSKENTYRADETIRADLHNIDSVSNLIDVPKDVLEGLRAELILADEAYYSRRIRPGQASEDHRCNQITGVPWHLTFIKRWFYKKYTHAYGIPVISSAAVSDAALMKACYIMRFLFADRRDVRQHMYKYFGRVGVIGHREETTTIPEFRHLPAWWNRRARGLGGTLHIPMSTGGEENILCWSTDRYRGADIFLHETAHSVAEVAIRGGAIRGYYPRLERQYNYARRTGLWRNTYAMSTVREYFAHGTQSYFDCNRDVSRPNGIHNHVNTRAELRNYDPALFRLLKEVYPCMNKYYWCYKGTPPDPRMNCDGSGRPQPTKPQPWTPVIPMTPPVPQTPAPPKPKPDCKDMDNRCPRWSWRGYCSHSYYGAYMRRNCKRSCSLCGSRNCEDTNGYCSGWKMHGYCGRNNYVDRHCRKSCGKC